MARQQIRKKVSLPSPFPILNRRTSRFWSDQNDSTHGPAVLNTAPKMLPFLFLLPFIACLCLSLYSNYFISRIETSGRKSFGANPRRHFLPGWRLAAASRTAAVKSPKWDYFFLLIFILAVVCALSAASVMCSSGSVCEQLGRSSFRFYSQLEASYTFALLSFSFLFWLLCVRCLRACVNVFLRSGVGNSLRTIKWGTETKFLSILQATRGPRTQQTYIFPSLSFVVSVCIRGAFTSRTAVKKKVWLHQDARASNVESIACASDIQIL